jgi:RNA polymerase sigma-70 factor (ECF subfamily)
VATPPGRETFEQAILPHLDAALTLARWLLRGAQDAEDVVQEAVMRALTYYGSFRGDNPRAWLLQIVRNAAFASLKLNRGLALAVQDGGVPVEIADPGEGPERRLMTQESRRAVADVITALPPDLREVVILREVEEMSYKDIARIVDAPVGTVMSRLWRARRLLAASLARREDVA